MTTKIVVLAAGRGTRMQAGAATELSDEQSAAAAAGEKAMMPVGRPFLDYALSTYADAGLREVCLVVRAGASAVRGYYEKLKTTRLSIRFAVQQQPAGVADAVLAAREFVGDDTFIVVNGDNFYPVRVISELRALRAPALAAFSRKGLLRDGQIDAARIDAYALLDIAADGALNRIVEKPSAAESMAMPDARVSMNAWLFDSRIFDACASVPRSPRGEFELPSAVQFAIDAMGMRFATFSADDSVLDLSSRADIPTVARRLRSARIEL